MLYVWSPNILWIIVISTVFADSDGGLKDLKNVDILSSLDYSCLIVGVQPLSQDVKNVLKQLTNVYMSEDAVEIGTLDTDNFEWPSGSPVRWKQSDVFLNYKKPQIEIAYFKKRQVDRTCLIKPPHVVYPMLDVYDGPLTIRALLPFINSVCGAFRDENGQLSYAGEERMSIMNNLYHVETSAGSNMGTIYSTKANPLNQSYTWQKVNEMETGGEEEDLCEVGSETRKPTKMAQCEVIDRELSSQEFLNNYLKKSKPFILKKAVTHWPAFQKWTNAFFKLKYGDQRVHIKLTPKGDFEGVEKADIWEDAKTFTIPDAVFKQLLYPDLVVVRPAHEEMLISDFIDLINRTAHQSHRNVSAYLEYSSIQDIEEDLEQDVSEPDFVKNLLKLQHTNIWLSDGDTLGRLHFDPFDNLLNQISGRKQVVLFEPFDNTKLYEAHIPQATLKYDKISGVFRRHGLEDTTSMVMSPVDILNPDFKRFPRFVNAVPLNCTIDEGDTLYMPAFWWHEVQSFPSKSQTERRNLAVNFWYEPFLKKEFPCADCSLDINPEYYHLLY